MNKTALFTGLSIILVEIIGIFLYLIKDYLLELFSNDPTLIIGVIVLCLINVVSLILIIFGLVGRSK